jgi:hypothetical protein
MRGPVVNFDLTPPSIISKSGLNVRFWHKDISLLSGEQGPFGLTPKEAHFDGGFSRCF